MKTYVSRDARKTGTYRSVLATLLIFFSWGCSHAASVLVNGSFEAASVDPGTTWIGLPVGDASISGWTVIQDTIHYMGTYWVASDGERSVDLDGASGDAGGIQQEFSTIAGATYEVTFDMSGNLAGGPTIKPMRVIADGQSTDFTFDITGITRADMGWKSHSWTFTADDTLATLQFLSLNSPSSYGPVIDSVSVELASNVVPIPAAAWLFASALGIVGYLGKRKATA